MLAAVSSLAIMAANPAVAQNQDEGNDEENLEEIIVVGRFQQSVIDRLPVSPEELPFTLNSLGREHLDELNYARPIDAIANLPNVSIFSDLHNTGTPLMLIRGYFAPILVDNRNENAFRGAGAQDDSFVDRYEVLKGPASVSVGAVESGGIMNTVTKTPEMDQFVGIELRTDQFGTIATEFDYNTGPIAGNDSLRFRVSGAYRNFQYDAKPTKRENFAIRPVVVADLADSTSVKVSASYVKSTVNANKGFPRFVDGTAPTQIGTDTFTGLRNGEGKSESKYISGEIIHDFLDNLTLKLRGSHQSTDFNYQNTSGLYHYRAGIPLDNPVVYSYSYAGDTDEKNTYLDAQLVSSFEWNGLDQDFVIGGTYNKYKFYRGFFAATEGYYLGPFPLDDLDTPRYGSDTFVDTPRVRNDDINKLHSLYLEAAIRPIEDLTIVGGVRYDEVNNFAVRGGALKNNDVTFRIGGTYQVSDGFGVYVSYAQAFTPQTGEFRAGGQPGPQTTGGWEIGLKGNLLDDTLKFNAAYFTATRTNVAVRDPNNSPVDSFVVTIPGQRTKGFEVSADWSPVEGFNLNVNYGYVDIEVLEGAEDVITEYSIPKNTFTAFASYEFLDGSLEGLKLGGGPRWVDKKTSTVPGFFYDAITLVDAFVSYPVTDNITVSLNAHNLMDKLYFESSGTFFGRTSGSHVLGAPRTVSLTVRARF